MYASGFHKGDNVLITQCPFDNWNFCLNQMGSIEVILKFKPNTCLFFIKLGLNDQRTMAGTMFNQLTQDQQSLANDNGVSKELVCCRIGFFKKHP